MTTAIAPGLARKIKKTLETRTETPEFLSSLSTLSEFYGENTAAERRKLRSTIERQGLAIDAQFLAAAETVITSLNAMDADLEQLSACCRRIGGALSSSKARTADMLTESRRLRAAAETSEARSGLVQRFLQQYQLSHDEVYALKEEEVGDRFFAALERVRLIHGNCRALLRGAHQRAGLELMDAMALHQEAAYERLCRWVQNECRGLGEADAPEVDPLLQRAAAALRARPVLFRYCAEEVAGARHGALFQRFIAALTRGGPGGMPRPIEMHAHDPRRYVGDMLAWVHQSLASERELLVSLFGDEPGSGGSGTDSSGAVADMPSTAELLDRVFESICKPLKVRIDQVLASGLPLLLCFRLSQLLGFYAETVAQLAGPGAALVASLQAAQVAQTAAARSSREQLAARATRLARHPPPPPADLSPPSQVAEGLQQLLEVVAAFESAYRGSGDGGGGSAAAAAAAEFEAVLAAGVDPLVEMCERSAEALKPGAPSQADEGLGLAPAARRMYLINCLAALHGSLAVHAASALRADAIGQGLEAHVAGLAGGHVEALLHRCKLDDVVGRIHFYQGGRVAEGTLMAADPALSLPRIQEAARAFLALVSDPASLPEFEHLQVPRLKADAAARVVRSLADAYEAVYQAVGDPSSGYVSAGTPCPLPHTPEQVRTILGVVT